METLSTKDLIALLNWQLAAYDECAGCRFTSIRRLRGRDDCGTNWVDAFVRADHRPGLPEQFIFRHIVEETRRRFDVVS